MRAFLQKLPVERIAFIACIALFVGLICSKFLISVAMIVLLLTGLVNATLTGEVRFWENKSYVATVAIFVLFALSVLLSDNMEEGWRRVRIALPLLVLPLAFACLPRLSQTKLKQLLALYVIAMVIASFGVLVNYYWHYEAMQQLLIVSKAIPTPNHEHIRFSLLQNMAIWAVIWLIQCDFTWRAILTKWSWSAMGLFLFLIIHVFSVRSGLLVLYGGIALSILYFTFATQRYMLGLGLIILLLIAPIFAVNYIPSVKTKYGLTVYNWQLFKKGHVGEYSDTRRLLSYKIAIDVASQAPFFGVGLGDLLDEQTKLYKRDYPRQKVMFPHNMFLTIYAAVGVFGLVLFLGLFFFPLWYRDNWKNYFCLLFFATVTLSFMTENTIFRALGMGIYIYFLMLCISSTEDSNISLG